MRRALLAASIVAVAVGCGAREIVGGDDDAGVEAPPTCTAFTCGSACVDLVSDPSNCGACGHVCDPSLRCIHAACDVDCSPPTVRCDPSPVHPEPWCADLSTDPMNCGGCTFRCSYYDNSNPTCSGGACGISCLPGFADCDAVRSNGCEVNVASDAKNCGSCGKACLSGVSCVDGACGACSAPSRICGGTCVDVSSDPNNCGDCGRACKSGTSCVAGACGGDCTLPRTTCGGLCVDTSKDPTNCGACGNVCPSGTTCVSSACTSAATCRSAPPSVLFYGTTGSVESPYLPASSVVKVATETEWRSMTSADFAKYTLVVIGEDDAGVLTSSMLQAAFDTRATWSAAITGRIAVLGIVPGVKAEGGIIGAQTFLESTLAWLSTGPVGTTSLYVACDWGTRNLDYLSPFGLFGESTANGDDVRILATTHPMMLGSTDASLSGWGSSTRTLLPTHPAAFAELAKGLGGPLTDAGPPPASGPVVLARDAICAP